MESLLVITNTEAGSVNEHSVRQAVEVLRTGADVQVCRTSVPGDLDGILHRRGGRTVVVAGGDGSLHSVVSALHRRMELDDTVIALIPLGTANDFARAMNLPLEPAAAARVVLSGVEQRRDLLIDCRGNVVVHRVRLTARPTSSSARPSLASGGVRVRVEAENAGQTHVLADLDRPLSWLELSNGAIESSTADPEGATTTHAARASDPEAPTVPDTPATADTPALDTTAPDTTAAISLAFAPRYPLPGPVTTLVSRTLRRSRPKHLVRSNAERIHVAGQRFFLSADGEVDGPEQNRTWTVARGRLRLRGPAG